MGDYYAGDPGFLSVLGKIGRAAGGWVLRTPRRYAGRSGGLRGSNAWRCASWRSQGPGSTAGEPTSNRGRGSVRRRHECPECGCETFAVCPECGCCAECCDCDGEEEEGDGSDNESR